MKKDRDLRRIGKWIQSAVEHVDGDKEKAVLLALVGRLAGSSVSVEADSVPEHLRLLSFGINQWKIDMIVSGLSKMSSRVSSDEARRLISRASKKLAESL